MKSMKVTSNEKNIGTKSNNNAKLLKERCSSETMRF